MIHNFYKFFKRIFLCSCPLRALILHLIIYKTGLVRVSIKQLKLLSIVIPSVRQITTGVWEIIHRNNTFAPGSTAQQSHSLLTTPFPSIAVNMIPPWPAVSNSESDRCIPKYMALSLCSFYIVIYLFIFVFII